LRPPRVNAMTPIKTAILSFGMSGRLFHAPFINLNPGFVFHSVWEREKNLAFDLYPEVQIKRTLEEILGDPEVELVIVNTPNYTHFEYAQKALAAGKHVVVEKPFAVTSAEAEALVKLAEVMKKCLTVYQNRRYDSDYKTIRQVLDGQLLGEMAEVEMRYDRFVINLSPKQHKETPLPGTGLVYDLGAHLIDQALQLFGNPQAVFGDMDIQRPHSLVDDYMEILLYYPGFRVRLKSGYLIREAPIAYSFYGRKGSFLKPRSDMQEKMLQAGAKPEGEGWGTEPESQWGLLHTEKDGAVIREYIPSLKGNYMEFYDQLHAAIRHGQPVPVSPEDGVRTIKIIELAYKSHRERRVVDFI
jgi:scyllo-inositol 2-dehydrogenase (NADP+)